jgi:hypothetical protein
MQQDDTVEQVETRSIPLRFEGKGVELLWRGPVALLLMLLVIPAAWGITMLARWFVNYIVTEDGRKLIFTGKAVEIMGHAIALLLVTFLPAFPEIFSSSHTADAEGVLQLLSFLFSTFIYWHILRWLASRTHFDGGSSFTFTGSFWSLLKHYLVLTFIGLPGLIFVFVGLALRETAGVFVMVLLIAGGVLLGIYLVAWYSIVFYNWAAKNIVESSNRFAFHTPAVAMFWRNIAVVLFCIPFFTFPWAMTWWFRWAVSQTTYEEAAPPQFAFTEDAPTASPDSDALPYPSIFS